MIEENDLKSKDAAVIEDTIDGFLGHTKEAKKDCLIDQLHYIRKTIFAGCRKLSRWHAKISECPSANTNMG